MTETPPTDRGVIAVDPHKASWTAAAVDASLQPLDIIRVPVSGEGYRALRRPPLDQSRLGRGWARPDWGPH